MQAVNTPDLANLVWDAYDGEGRLREGCTRESDRQGQFDIATEPSGQRRFWYVCPGKCKSLSAIAIRPVVDGSAQSWDWDGNMVSPTLTPSINHVGCWHGWLTGGKFIGC